MNIKVNDRYRTHAGAEGTIIYVDATIAVIVPDGTTEEFTISLAKAERDHYRYLENQTSRTPATIDFPANVVPTPCTRRTNSFLRIDEHGTTRIVFAHRQMDFWIMHSLFNGNLVLTRNPHEIRATPCGPNCINTERTSL